MKTSKRSVFSDILHTLQWSPDIGDEEKNLNKNMEKVFRYKSLMLLVWQAVFEISINPCARYRTYQCCHNNTKTSSYLRK